MQSETSQPSNEDAKQPDIVLDLNNPYKFYWDIKRKQRITILKEYIVFSKVEERETKMKDYLNEHMRRDEYLIPVPFKLWYANAEPRSTQIFNHILSFISDLIQCENQLFHKFMCYFKAPKRLFDPVPLPPCTILSDGLIKFREYCKKSEVTKLSVEEKSDWVSIMLQISGYKSKDTTYSFGSMTFSMDNTLVCSNKFNLIGFKSETADCHSDKSFKQLLYTFPAMMIQVLATNPSKFTYEDHVCILFSTECFMINKVLLEKKNQTTIKIHQVVKKFSFSRQDMTKALVTLSQHNNLRRRTDNICLEALNLSIIKHKMTMSEFYQYLLETKKNTTKATKPSLSYEQKQQIKERTQSILKETYLTKPDLLI